MKSRILYEQMMGRGTRLCSDSKVFPELDKKVFRIFDAVQLYQDMQDFTDMKPVVTQPKISYEQLAREITSITDPGAQKEFLEQFIVKLQRKKLGQQSREEFETLTQMTVKEVADLLRSSSLEEAIAWIQRHPRVPSLLDSATGDGTVFLISDHPDAVRRVERGYGPNNARPSDYLESFASFVQSNINTIPALLVVTQRPRDLTRAQLKELRQLLANEGYTATSLRSAYQETTNVEIAASIIGFIRQQALGSPLVPYEERVDRAYKKILASHKWTPPQRQWLDAFANQMKKETIVDREALEQGRFKDLGGFTRFNKVFEGKIEKVLADFQAAAWDDDVA